MFGRSRASDDGDDRPAMSEKGERDAPVQSPIQEDARTVDRVGDPDMAASQATALSSFSSESQPRHCRRLTSD